MQLTSSVAVVNGHTMHHVIAIRLGCCKYCTTNTFSSLIAILPFGRRHCQALIVHARDIILIILKLWVAFVELCALVESDIPPTGEFVSLRFNLEYQFQRGVEIHCKKSTINSNLQCDLINLCKPTAHNFQILQSE